MALSNFSPWDIYNSKSKFKILILMIALVIGGASIYYTQQLVNKLAERERKLIDLYAKALKFAGNPENTGDLSFIFEMQISVIVISFTGYDIISLHQFKSFRYGNGNFCQPVFFILYFIQ